MIYARIVGTVFPGWTSIVAGGLFISGFIILSTGITGLYIGKVFDQVRARPVFVVDRFAEGRRDERARELLGAAHGSPHDSHQTGPHVEAI